MSACRVADHPTECVQESGEAMSYARFTQTLLVSCLLALNALSQQLPEASADPLQQRAPQIELDNQSIVDGIAMLSYSTGLAVSVEFPLGTTISGPAPTIRLFSTKVSASTASQMLDRLCALDSTFTWTRNGNTVNVYPVALENDALYLLNRKIQQLSLQDVQKADDAVMSMVGGLSGPRQQLAVLQIGTSLNFPHPWNATLSNVTVREVLDDIAQQLGPTYGWVLSGGQDFRIVTFHERMLPRPSRRRQESGPSGEGH